MAERRHGASSAWCFRPVRVARFRPTLPSEWPQLVGLHAVPCWWTASPFIFFYLFLAGAAIAILMSVRYLEIEHENHGEFYALMLFSVVGMMCMAAGFDIVLLFIGLELMAISTYVLVGFLRRDRRSNEAALKYLLLGAFSSGIFAYGLSLFYGLTGSTNLGDHRASRSDVPASRIRTILSLIFALLTTMTGLLFKIAAVPFHQWAPDAYEGAPTSVTGFMSVAVKAAGWAMLLRIFLLALVSRCAPMYVPLLVFVSIATMTGGNLAAITQTNLKRLLAYSSIAHVGYMLLGAGRQGTRPRQPSPRGIKGILIYLLVYTFMNLGAFAVITSLRRRNIIGDEIDDIAGLYSRAPVEAVLMLIFLLSLAGIPPLAGFWGKYFIFLSLIESQHYTLASVAVLYAVFGLYYYMRIANAMLMRDAHRDRQAAAQPGHALRAGSDGLRHSRHRRLPRALHPNRELDARDRASPPRDGNGEIATRLRACMLARVFRNHFS